MKTKNPAAVALGSIKSKKKSKQARENGKLGGRPKSVSQKIKEALEGNNPFTRLWADGARKTYGLPKASHSRKTP